MSDGTLILQVFLESYRLQFPSAVHMDSNLLVACRLVCRDVDTYYRRYIEPLLTGMTCPPIQLLPGRCVTSLLRIVAPTASPELLALELLRYQLSHLDMDLATLALFVRKLIYTPEAIGVFDDEWDWMQQRQADRADLHREIAQLQLRVEETGYADTLDRIRELCDRSKQLTCDTQFVQCCDRLARQWYASMGARGQSSPLSIITIGGKRVVRDLSRLLLLYEGEYELETCTLRSLIAVLRCVPLRELLTEHHPFLQVLQAYRYRASVAREMERAVARYYRTYLVTETAQYDCFIEAFLRFNERLWDRLFVLFHAYVFTELTELPVTVCRLLAEAAPTIQRRLAAKDVTVTVTTETMALLRRYLQSLVDRGAHEALCNTLESEGVKFLIDNSGERPDNILTIKGLGWRDPHEHGWLREFIRERLRVSALPPRLFVRFFWLYVYLAPGSCTVVSFYAERAREYTATLSTRELRRLFVRLFRWQSWPHWGSTAHRLMRDCVADNMSRAGEIDGVAQLHQWERLLRLIREPTLLLSDEAPLRDVINIYVDATTPHHLCCAHCHRTTIQCVTRMYAIGDIVLRSRLCSLWAELIATRIRHAFGDVSVLLPDRFMDADVPRLDAETDGWEMEAECDDDDTLLGHFDSDSDCDCDYDDM